MRDIGGRKITPAKGDIHSMAHSIKNISLTTLLKLFKINYYLLFNFIIYCFINYYLFIIINAIFIILLFKIIKIRNFLPIKTILFLNRLLYHITIAGMFSASDYLTLWKGVRIKLIFAFLHFASK